MAAGSIARRQLAPRAVARGALCALAWGATDVALGRGGGGHHAASIAAPSSSHGGSSFGAGGGSGGSPGSIIGLLIVVLVVYLIYRRISARRRQDPGALGALGAVAAAVAAAQSGARTAGAAAAPVGPATPLDDSPALQATVEAIRARDPGFELETFLQRAEMTFFLVKRGMQNNDASAIRPYLSDATFAQVSKGIALMQSQHQRQLLESLNVRGLHLLGADSNDQQQRLQVHFDLVYRAKTLGERNQLIADERVDAPHGELWSFTRSASARTPVSGGVTAARCPACGAQLQLNLDGSCAHCRASVTNGSVDWVVADVQSAEFIGQFAHVVPGEAAASLAEGVAALRTADQAFTLDDFLARTRTAFLALQDAWCRQDLDAGRAFLSPGAYFSWRAQLETLAAEGRRNVMENISVLGIVPVQLVHGRVFDDLTVRISAAAADYEVDASGRVVFGDRTVRPFAEDWTFQRSVGAATLAKPGTLENTCPNCGAPVSLNQIGECRYCKAAVTSGKFDWVVSRIEQIDEQGGERAGEQAGMPDLGTQLAVQLGGALVGGLLGSLLSGNSSDDSRDY